MPDRSCQGRGKPSSRGRALLSVGLIALVAAQVLGMVGAESVSGTMPAP